ncbi:MAG: putative sensor domain DACNV-containing protein [Candidatus Sericytochromatia bacterium]
MSEFAFPADLADEISALWAELGAQGTSTPPLPPSPVLRRLVEVAFLASLVTEEGRALAFTLCCTPEGAVVRRPAGGGEVEAIGLQSDRLYDVTELRRLAVATNPTGGALWIQFAEADEPLRIHGLLNLGLSWEMAHMGLSNRLEPMPDALILHVDGPGAITVLVNQAAVLTLSNGRIQRPRTIINPSRGRSRFFQDGVGALYERLAAEGGATAPEARALLEHTYIRVLRTIVTGIRELGHGGAVVIAGAESPALDPARALVRPRYPTDRPLPLLAEHVLRTVTLRLALLAGPSEACLERQAIALELRAAGFHLIEAANMITSLSGTDGAIVLQSDLGLLGFGAEIAVEPRLPSPVLEYMEGAEARPVDPERFGMRHRSALWLVATAPDTSVFVVSQDGNVSFAFSYEGQAYLIPRLEPLRFAAESAWDMTRERAD